MAKARGKKSLHDVLKGAPGMEELQTMCDSARQVKSICDALGFEFRGSNHLIALFEGALRKGVSLEVMIEDPDNRPYIWDLDEEDHA